MTAPVRRARSWAARLSPFALALLALPLLGPTCGGQQPGQKAFAKTSLIIPMDGCYQFATDNTGQSATRAGCGTATSDNGDVIKAYGLVYQLVRAGVPVYWLISPTKASATGVDVAVSYAGGPPVVKYNWNDANGAGGSRPANNSTSTFSYVGGPFVVDGSDYAAANAVLQGFRATYSAVNVHVTQVAFQGYAAKVFSGGWNAGGAVAPKLALLNIPGGDGRYADHVLEGYLVRSALAPACVLANPPCADNSAGTATGTHGNIYDRLEAADFIPPTCTSSAQCEAIAAGSACLGNGRCDWKSTNLHRAGYKVLWLPHWTGPNSCEGTLNNGYTCGTGFGGCSFAGGDTCSCVHNCTANLTQAELSLVLQTIGGFQAAGNDVFGECGGIGTMEGTYDTNTATVTASFGPGDASSRFVTTGTGIFPAGGGVWINEDWSGGTPPTTVFDAAWFPSPFLQIGDFPFRPQTGLIQSYRPALANGAAFRSTVVHLISEPSGSRVDIFSHVPAAGSAGNVVYLTGHDYSGFQGIYQIAGTRLVLNTLFNLSATCQPRLTACSQMKNFGTCRPGAWQCCSADDIAKGYCQVEGEPVCRPTDDTHGTETCNGLDDDCDGIVDNIGPTDSHVSSPGCYDGPPATVNPATGKPYGTCQQGVWSCQQTGTPQSPSAAWVCVGEVLPGVEACNGLDDDCNGAVDDNVPFPGGTASCFTGPPGAVMQSTFPQSQCKPGTWACRAIPGQGPAWVCLDQVLPQQEICEGPLLDYNCNGIVGDGCECVVGTTRACYTGPAGTAGHGICRTGRQSCVQDPTRPAGQGLWDNPTCSDQVLPSAGGETCGNGIDDNCDGFIDEGCAECTAGQTRKCYPAGVGGCTGSPGGPYSCAGVCAPGDQVCIGGKWSGACAGAITPSPERCDGLDNACTGTLDETSAPCPAPLACLNGLCTQPTWGGESQCLPGYVHDAPGTSGSCVPEPCPSSPCPAGRLCQGGGCLDPCAGTTCGAGAFCSLTATVQPICIGGGCSASGCTGGNVCRNGVCQADVCAGVSCPDGTFRRGNYGLATPTCDCVRVCATVSCPVGQACGPDGFCAPDPCATLTCPAGQVCRASGASGTCIADPCPTGICGAGQACADGRCIDDPCAGVVCPAGICARGQCYASNNPNGYGQPPTTPTPAGSTSSGGCGCGGGEAGPTALLLSLLALPVARRRRTSLRKRGAPGGVALLLVGLVALGAGCSSKKKSSPPLNCETCGTGACVDVRFDAAHCASCATSCAASQVCVDSVCIAAAPSVPSISRVSPAPAPAAVDTFTIDGDRFQSGALLRVSGAGLPATEVATTFASSTQLTASVNLSSALSGTLSLQVANPDHTVSNIYAVQVVTPTPSIDRIDPPTAVAGSQAPVHVTGSGFTPSAVCVQRAGAAEIVIPPTATPTSTELDCILDLSAVAPGTIQIVIQNENLVESTPFPFDVASATPSIASLSPNPAQQGSEIRLIVTGAGFVPNSTVQLGQGGTYSDLLTSYAASTLLQAELSLTGAAAGTYQVRVVNPGAPSPSPPVDLVVTPTVPVATSLTVTPASPRLGDVGVQLAFTGSGFTGSCQVQVLRAGAGSTWLGSPEVVTAAGTTAGTIRGTTDMTGSEGTWYARVTCPAGCPSPPCLTSGFPFQVLTNVASLASATPAGGGQGATVPVTVTGANFAAGMMLRLSGAAADIPSTLDAATPSSRATASIPLAGLDTGTHLLRAVNPGASESNGIGFSVTPGAPSISGTSTSCPPAVCTAACAVQQESPATVIISGSNFGSGISVAFATSSLGRFELTPPLATMTVLDASTIQVVLDTTQVPGPLPATFTVTVENPGQPPSNGVSYKVATACP